MSRIKIVGSLLIVAGILGLVYGGFSYTTETHKTKIGSFEMSMTDKDRINVPIWVGVGAIVIGAGVLLAPWKSKG